MSRLSDNQQTFICFLFALLVAMGIAAPFVSFAADTGRDLNTKSHSAQSYYAETTIATYRDALDGGEAGTDLGGASILAVTELTVQGFPNASISGRFSASGATAEIVFTRWRKVGGVLTFKSMDTATLTANTTYTIGGDFASRNALAFDTQGCDVIKVLVADPSSGDVNLFAEVF